MVIPDANSFASGIIVKSAQRNMIDREQNIPRLADGRRWNRWFTESQKDSEWGLTARQKEVGALIMTGLNIPQISLLLGISKSTTRKIIYGVQGYVYETPGIAGICGVIERVTGNRPGIKQLRTEYRSLFV